MFCQHCGQEIGEAYVRKLIRDELRHLDQETTDKLTEQITTRLAITQRACGVDPLNRPRFETKIIPVHKERNE